MDNYRGRFAPSPTGPLHFGSLIAALGSWLDARHNNGEWLVRIEDIDPPREVDGAADLILKTLDSYGLYWDQTVLYQSSNQPQYQQILETLLSQDKVYRCTCTRKKIRLIGGVYKNLCRTQNHNSSTSHSLRLKVNDPILAFDDYYLGTCETEHRSAQEDFILKRKDGLFAYMLAVVVDDIQQNITHVIRGADLLETTTQQLYLYNQLEVKPPVFGHLPLAVNHLGLKLSKQNHAPGISLEHINETLWQALIFLNQNPDESLKKESKENLLAWAIEHWKPELFRDKQQIAYTDLLER